MGATAPRNVGDGEKNVCFHHPWVDKECKWHSNNVERVGVSGGWTGGNSITVVKISRAFRSNCQSTANKRMCVWCA